MFAQTTNRILLGWLILALLLGQGLRVCIHTYDPSAQSVSSVAPIHIENSFDDDEPIATDVHMDEVPLLGLLKGVVTDPLIAIIFLAFLLVPLALHCIVRLGCPDRSVLRLDPGYYPTPPLRAPPR